MTPSAIPYLIFPSTSYIKLYSNYTHGTACDTASDTIFDTATVTQPKVFPQKYHIYDTVFKGM